MLPIMHVDQLPPIRVEQGILISREKKKYKQTMKDMAEGQTLIVLKIDEKNNEISCYEKRMCSRKKKKGRP